MSEKFKATVSYSAIKRYIDTLNDAGLSTHDIIIAVGDEILFEKYFPPFHKDYLHREYSDTKSIVSIAVGFAEQDGLVDLDAPISKYFPKECEGIGDPKMGEQTVRQMLKMSTPKHDVSWFRERGQDRVADYFTKFSTAAPLGSRFQYDSAGSFILGAMVERVTGKLFVDYLREKLFDKLGVSKELRCLKATGGHSWGDSAVLAKARDMMLLVKFLLDGGKIGDEQVLNAEYVAEALKKQIDTHDGGRDSFGYGYQIWRTFEDSFYFNGMGCQFALGNPAKNAIFVINSDNQGLDKPGDIIIEKFFEIVYPTIGEDNSDDTMTKEELDAYVAPMVLAWEKGEAHKPIEDEIAGKTYVLGENQMGIKWVRFDFAKNSGVLEYENAQGNKSIAFGLGKNLFTIFPEEGYAREVGTVITPGNYYKCASSAAWKSDKRLVISQQVIDEYFGRCWMTFDFEGDTVKVNMRKTAEDFFWTYFGEAEGKAN